MNMDMDKDKSEPQAAKPNSSMDMGGNDHDMDDMGGMDMSGGKLMASMDMDMGGMQMFMYWNTKVTFLIKGNSSFQNFIKPIRMGYWR